MGVARMSAPKIPADDMRVAQWPSDVPLPTQAHFIQAQDRMRIAREKWKGCGFAHLTNLGYEMATTHIGCWWHYFFTDSERFRIWPKSKSGST